ncbi:MAG: M4 family metallopeptidase, partial [Acidobacteria bacterium]|nr:M4 family metallopeptidase [Acidobacteriota bacterium]
AGRPPALVVLPLDEGGYALAWQAETRSGTDVRFTFVDAVTGKVLLDYSDLQTDVATAVGDSAAVQSRPAAGDAAPAPAGLSHSDQQQPGTVTMFDLRGDLARTMGVVSGRVTLGPADVASTGGDAARDPAVADAFAHVAATRDVLLQRFGRRGLDGRDGPITAVVHPVNAEDWSRLRSRYRLFYTGAFWDGRTIMLGEGLPPGATVEGRTWARASAALDVVAHELTHGVINFSSGLIYRNESGALNEAFADIMATAVEFSVQPAGTGRSKADYLVGEDVASGGGLRSLEDPAAQGHPDHYDRRVAGPADNGGVHANATIAGHVYYLAIEGGTNRTSGLQVEGVGRSSREQIEKVFYRAFVYLLPSSATFADARVATVQSARDLYGPGSTAERALTQAWTAVGVK